MIEYVLILLLVLYLIYLSVLDIKYRKLEYWQTSLLYVFCAALPVYNYVIVEFDIKNIVFSILASVFSFLLMLFFSVSKSTSAFGGADLWVTGALGLVFGIVQIWIVLFMSCLSCCIYAVLYRLFKKKKESRVPFVPFLSIGALSNILLIIVI